MRSRPLTFWHIEQLAPGRVKFLDPPAFPDHCIDPPLEVVCRTNLRAINNLGEISPSPFRKGDLVHITRANRTGVPLVRIREDGEESLFDMERLEGA